MAGPKQITYIDLIEEVKKLVFKDTRHVKDIILDDEDLETFPKPNLTSNDPAERIIARRLRTRTAMERLLALEEKRERRELGIEETEDEDEVYDDENVVEHQIEETTKRLLNLMEDGKDLVSNVKVAAVSYEDKRRKDDRERRAERRNELEEKAEKAKKDFMEISNKWNRIKNINDPLDIHNATEDQRENCLKVLEKKDEIIRDLKEDLELADLNFIRDLAQQEEDLNILINRINQHVNIMRASIRCELNLLENAIAEEREEIIKGHEIEWDQLVQRKRNVDDETHKKRMELYHRHQTAIDFLDSDLRRILGEKRTEQMITIQTQQLNLQKLRANCLFNHDKFKFNTKLLQKRRRENIIVKANCRRIVMKLQYYVFMLKRKIQDTNKAMKQEIKATYKELSHMYQAIKSVEAKGATRARSNCTMYFDLWKTNEKEAKLLSDYIHQKRLLLCENFFNIPPPPKKIWPQLNDMASYRKAISLKTAGKPVKKESWDVMRSLSNWTAEKRALHTVLDHMASYASFLVEDHVRQTANELLNDPNDRVVITLDNLLMVLGIKSTEQIKMMTKHFLPIMRCETCKKSNMEVNQEAIPANDMSEEICSNCQNVKSDGISVDDNPDSAIDQLSSSVRERTEVIDKLIQFEYSAKHCVCKSKAVCRIQTAETVSSEDSVVSISPCQETKAHESVQEVITDEEIDNCLNKNHKISIERAYLLKALVNLSKELNLQKTQSAQKSFQGAAMLKNQWWTIASALDDEDIDLFWNSISMPKKACEIWDYYIDLLYRYQQALTERQRLNEEIQRVKKINQDLLKLLHCSILSPDDETVSVHDLQDLYRYLPEIEQSCKK